MTHPPVSTHGGGHGVEQSFNEPRIDYPDVEQWSDGRNSEPQGLAVGSPLREKGLFKGLGGERAE